MSPKDKEERSYVYLKDCLKDLKKDQYKIPIILGKDEAGDIITKDLADIPNILMAGATGTGKSVSLNSVIYTLLKTKTSEELWLLLIDHKQVEFYIYDGIPYLSHPVITDVETSYKVLTKVTEMIEERLKEKKKSPYLVILIDEFADFIIKYKEEAEDILTRIATEGKTVGIHMILSTSSPSESVFTDKLRELIPGRIAGALASKEDSQRVLDQGGAEDFLGNGDMLYKNMEEVIRIQVPFISSEEVDELVKTLKTRKCLCNNPDCGKCLLINCKDDDCKVHTKEKKKEARRRAYYPRIKRLLESRTRITPEVMQKEFHLGYMEGGNLLNEFWDDELERYPYIYARVKEEIRKNGSVDRSFLQKEFTMSVVHAARLMKILEGDTRFMKVRG